MDNRQEILKELESISPELASLKKEEVQPKLSSVQTTALKDSLKQIPEKEKGKTRKLWYKRLGVAAAACMAIFLIMRLSSNTTRPPADYANVYLSNEEIVLLDELESDDLIQYLYDDNSGELNVEALEEAIMDENNWTELIN